jgi:hypothetical protein
VQLPARLRIKPSPSLALLLATAHCVAATAALLSADIVVAIPLVGLIGASLVFAVRRATRPAIVGLVLRADGQIEIQRRNGESEAATIRPQTTVFPWLVILSVAAEAGPVSLVLLSDALGSESDRKLRLWLRWKAVSAPLA